MTNEELTLYNIGENLDSLMTLDPRGYGVCASDSNTFSSIQWLMTQL